MIENLVDFINVMLLQHPHLLQLMHTLFWVKYWMLMGIMGVFIYLIYFDKQAVAQKAVAITHASDEGVFIA